jgi:hypothetical protein
VFSTTDPNRQISSPAFASRRTENERSKPASVARSAAAVRSELPDCPLTCWHQPRPIPGTGAARPRTRERPTPSHHERTAQTDRKSPENPLRKGSRACTVRPILPGDTPCAAASMRSGHYK